MAENSLKLRIVFKGDNTNDINAWKRLILFFDRYSVVYCDTEPRKVIQDPIYVEQLFEATINIRVKHDNVGTLLSKMCKSWCRRNESPCTWLIPMSRELLVSKKPFHHLVETKEFAFGTLADMRSFVQHYCYKSDTDVNCSFYHNKKIFSLFLSISHNADCKQDQMHQKFNINYDTIARVLIFEHEKSVEIFFHLFSPPFVYVERNNIYNKKNNRVKSKAQDRSFPSTVSEQNFQEQKWERTLKFGCQCKRSECSINEIGKALVMKIVFSSSYKAHNITERLMQRCSTNVEFCYTPVQTIVPRNILATTESFSFFSSNELTLEKDIHLFSCQYAWELLLSSSYEVPDQLTLMYNSEMSISTDHWSFLKNDLLGYAERNPQALTNTLFHISEMMLRNTIFTFTSALKKIFQHYCKTEQKIDLPPGICLVRRVIITPSRTILLPLTESFDNRVIRELPHGTEYMLRVSVQDDNGSKLTFAVHYHSERDAFMKSVAGDHLKSGIRIGNRIYEFLAASNSQLREHGLWMYAKDPSGKTASDIRKWMGDFSNIKNVAKYMARMGQCFSTSDEAVQITLLKENKRCIPDIKTADEKYTFSDGIGMISQEIAIEIRKAKERNDNSSNNGISYTSSAYQIRYKGCKGMVCENPSLSGRQLYYRPSMEKFTCKSANKLEIVKISAPRALYLNRPLITILEQLGIKPDVFGKLQREMIFDLTDSLIYEEKAAHMLSNFLSLAIPFLKLQQAGINLTEEPFFRSLLIAIYKNAVDKLRTKARIAVPHQFGRNMLGVLDETGCLRYGEIFVQYSEQLGCNPSNTHILTGIVVVTKNPCMHPGDVRKLKAVDIKGLHHIKDCIVFPANGHRPHPDEMAGSDLDGDEYVVMWSEELRFPDENFEAMDYPVIQEAKAQNKIGVNEMIDFLCKYIQDDNIGTFANAHLAWADKLPDGIFSETCKNIALKYPYVLDFAKTGESEYLSKEEKPTSYPDFMEKSSICNSYRSERALGSLYRFVRSLGVCVNKADLANCNVTPDPTLEYSGWERYKESAVNMFSSYKERVTMILNKYGIKCEAEALSGHIVSLFNHNKGRREMENVITVIKSYLIHTMAKYHYLFLREVECETQQENLSREEAKERKFQRASAWYMVVYCNQLNSSILSFPWILSDILIDIHNENLRKKEVCSRTPVESSLLYSLDNLLIHSFSCICDSSESCVCITITKTVIREWMITSQLSLAMFASKNPCFQCFDRIFTHFITCSGIKCCSWDDDYCCCKFFCSPSVLIMKFLKFYIPNIMRLGKCEGSCTGFQDINLQTTVLQTYVSLAVTRNFKYLGLSFDEMAPESDHSIQEGDPIRISLVGDLKSLMNHRIIEIKNVLMELTGVTDIQTSTESEKGGTECMLISSTGTSCQRWFLEELMIDSNIADRLKEKLALS